MVIKLAVVMRYVEDAASLVYQIMYLRLILFAPLRIVWINIGLIKNVVYDYESANNVYQFVLNVMLFEMQAEDLLRPSHHTGLDWKWSKNVDKRPHCLAVVNGFVRP